MTLHANFRWVKKIQISIKNLHSNCDKLMQIQRDSHRNVHKFIRNRAVHSILICCKFTFEIENMQLEKKIINLLKG